MHALTIVKVFNDTSFLTGIILEILFRWIWIILIQGPLYIIDLLMKPNGIFDYLNITALPKILFGSVDDTFKPSHLPYYFTVLSCVALALIIIMFIMQLIIIQFTETHTVREKLGKAIKNTLLSLVVIACIPFFFTILNYLMTGLMVVLTNAAFGKSDLADTLWGLGGPKDVPVPADFGFPSWGYLEDWNFLIEFVGVWFVLYVFITSSMVLVERIIDLVLLISISPIVAAMMPVDQGKRLGVWKEMVIGKFIIGPGTMLPIYIFLNILPIVVADASGMAWFQRQILIAVFCAAGAVSCLKTQKLINHLVTQNLGVQGAIDSNGGNILSTIAGKASGFANLASGGIDALKFGKKMAFGGSNGEGPGGRAPDANGQGGQRGGLLPMLGRGAFSTFPKYAGRVKGAYNSSGGWKSGLGWAGLEGTGLSGTGRSIRNSWNAAKNATWSTGSAFKNAYKSGRDRIVDSANEQE